MRSELDSEILDAVPVSMLATAYADFHAAGLSPGADFSTKAKFGHKVEGLQLDVGFDAIMRKFWGLADPIALGTRVSFIRFRTTPRAMKRLSREVGIAAASEADLRNAILVAAASTPITIDDYDHDTFVSLVIAALQDPNQSYRL